jgi:hypothetical protein
MLASEPHSSGQMPVRDQRDLIGGMEKKWF